MNYRYVVGDEDIILSKEEHSKILSLQEQGAGRVVFLRDGTLGLNPAHIKSVHETEQMTIEQEKQREAQLRLAEAQSNVKSNYPRETHEAFYAKMGWTHELNCNCKTIYAGIKNLEEKTKF